MSRFGTFSGLTTTTSSSSDVYPNTVTFTFRSAKYASQYVEFAAVETTDRDQNPLQSPSPDQQQLVTKYDSAGTIPFVDFANKYAFNGATYTPDVIGGMSWLAVSDALKSPDSAQAKAILDALRATASNSSQGASQGFIVTELAKLLSVRSGAIDVVMFTALAYFVLPTDAVPDFIAGLGYTDDAAPPQDSDACRGFLQKPFTSTALVNKVRELLDARPAAPA